MRGTRAKQIRKAAFLQAASSRQKIKWFKRMTGKTGDDGKPHFSFTGTVRWEGFRRIYQDMKKQHTRRA